MLQKVWFSICLPPGCAADIDGVESFQQGDGVGSKAKEVQMVLVNGVTP